MSAEEKCIYPNTTRAPPNTPPSQKSLLWKYILHQFHTLITQSMSDSIHLCQSVSVSIFTVGTFIFLKLTPNILTFFTAFHDIPTSIPFIAIDMQHFLKSLHSQYWRDVLPFLYNPHWRSNKFILLGLQTYLNPWSNFIIFSTYGVSGVNNFKYVCSGFWCCVFGLISPISWLFLWFLICDWSRFYVWLL